MSRKTLKTAGLIDEIYQHSRTVEHARRKLVIGMNLTIASGPNTTNLRYCKMRIKTDCLKSKGFYKDQIVNFRLDFDREEVKEGQMYLFITRGNDLLLGCLDIYNTHIYFEYDDGNRKFSVDDIAILGVLVQ